MRRETLKIGLLGGLLFLGSCSAGGIGGGLLVRKALSDFMTRVDSVVGNATTSGDYLVEKAARQADLLLANADRILSDQLDKTVRSLAGQQQIFWQGLERTVAGLERLRTGILQLEDFVALDLQSLINQLPFKRDVYRIRRIDGYSQHYRAKGSYSFTVVGGACGPGFRFDIKVGDHKVAPNSIVTDRAFTTQFTVPVEKLNSLFQEDRVVRVPLTFASNEARRNKRVFLYQDQLLLLPRRALTYKLTEETEVRSWSSPKTSAEGKAFLGPTGKKGREQRTTVSTTIPSKARMLKHTAHTWASRDFGPASHAYWVPRDKPKRYRFSNDGRTISLDVAHIVHDNSTTFHITVQYQDPVFNPATREAVFRTPTGTAVPGGLGFGTYLCKLSERNRSFTLHGTYFNGEKFTITPAALTKGLAEVRMEKVGSFKRLTLIVSPPKR